MQEVYDFLSKCDAFFLATMDGDQPRVRPFGIFNVFENKLYVQTGKTKDVSKQMMLNPKIEICAMNNDEWIRIQAMVVDDNRNEAIMSMLDNHPGLKELFSATVENTKVFYLIEAIATITSFKGSPRILKF